MAWREPSPAINLSVGTEPKKGQRGISSTETMTELPRARGHPPNQNLKTKTASKSAVYNTGPPLASEA